MNFTPAGGSHSSSSHISTIASIVFTIASTIGFVQLVAMHAPTRIVPPMIMTSSAIAIRPSGSTLVSGFPPT